MELQKNPQHIVWLDVVRFVAMFTRCLLSLHRPFNFYPGTPPNIGEIKTLGCHLRSLASSLRPPCS